MHACEIEFFGGPLDGHAELMVLPLEPFLGVKTVPELGPQGLLVGLMRYFQGGRPAATTPLAVYELTERHEDSPCFRYLGSQAVSSEQLRDGYCLSTVVRRLSKPAVM